MPAVVLYLLNTGVSGVYTDRLFGCGFGGAATGDPLNLATSDEKFAQYQAAEIKHGRGG